MLDNYESSRPIMVKPDSFAHNIQLMLYDVYTKILLKSVVDDISRLETNNHTRLKNWPSITLGTKELVYFLLIK